MAADQRAHDVEPTRMMLMGRLLRNAESGRTVGGPEVPLHGPAETGDRHHGAE